MVCLCGRPGLPRAVHSAILFYTRVKCFPEMNSRADPHWIRSLVTPNNTTFSSSDSVPVLSIGPRAEQHQVLDGGFKNNEGIHSPPYSKGLDLEDRHGQKHGVDIKTAMLSDQIYIMYMNVYPDTVAPINKN